MKKNKILKKKNEILEKETLDSLRLDAVNEQHNKALVELISKRNLKTYDDVINFLSKYISLELYLHPFGTTTQKFKYIV